MENEKLELEVKQKDEVITKVKEEVETDTRFEEIVAVVTVLVEEIEIMKNRLDELENKLAESVVEPAEIQLEKITDKKSELNKFNLK